MLYFELEAPLKLLNDPQKGRLLSAILEYAHYGVIPEFGDPLLGMAWSFVKSDIDRDGERYRDTVHKKRISGITSDFKRNYAPKHGISPDDEEALQEYIRQRLSADVDECQPTTITSSTRTTNQTPTPMTASAAVGKGFGGNPSDNENPKDFETMRQERLDQVRAYLSDISYPK